MSTGIVADLETPLTPNELLAALGAHERQAARLSLAVRAVETSGVWAGDGSVSITAWLRNHARMTNADAARWIGRGRFLDRFGAVGTAAVGGVLSASQIGALQTVTTTRVETVLAEMQAEIVDILAPLSPGDTVKACQQWKQRADAIIDITEPKESVRRLSMSRGADGTLVGSFALDGCAAEEFDKAIRLAMTGGKDDPRTPTQVSADALHDMAAFYVRNNDRPGTARNQPQIELSMHADTLSDMHPAATGQDGQPLDADVVDT